MNRRTFVKTLPALTLVACTIAGEGQDASSPASDLKPIALLKPDRDGGKSVLASLQERKTTRNITSKALPPQMLSNLLWAAFGVNRDKGSFGKPGRTAASASNSQEIDLYVVLPEAVYLYEAAPHRLVPVANGDLRRHAGRGAAATAPVNIFYVVDLSRYDTGPSQPDRRIGDPEVQKSYYYTDTGLIAGNVYLELVPKSRFSRRHFETGTDLFLRCIDGNFFLGIQTKFSEKVWFGTDRARRCSFRKSLVGAQAAFFWTMVASAG